MFNNIRLPEILIILLIVVLLFGAKKLPDLARGVGRSLRIFKAETKGLRGDDEADEQVEPPRRDPEVETKPVEPVHNPVSEGVVDQPRRDA